MKDFVILNSHSPELRSLERTAWVVSFLLARKQGQRKLQHKMRSPDAAIANFFGVSKDSRPCSSSLELP